MERTQRENIIELASTMFVTEGIKAVRMDDVAHSAGISKRTLYEMFGDKEELIYEAMKLHFEKFEKENNERVKNAPNIIIEMLQATEIVIRNSEVNWRILNSLRRFHPAIGVRLHQERAQDRYEEFKRKLKMGMNQGIIDNRVNVELAMAMIYSTATSMVQSDGNYMLPNGVTPQAALHELTIYFLRGISTASGMAIIDEYIALNEKSKAE